MKSLTILLFVIGLALTNASFGGYGPYRGFGFFKMRAPEEVLNYYRDNSIPNWALEQPSPWGSRFFFKRSVPSVDDDKVITQCKFNSTGSKLKCTRLDKSVECDTVEVYDKLKSHKFSSYGISATPSKVGSKVTYSLYPERLDKNGWKHSKIRDSITRRIYQYSLYNGVTDGDNGFRVKDQACYDKLQQLFSEVKVPQKVQLGMKPGKVDDATIVGVVARI